MTDWTDIHPDFTEELQVEWEGFGFDYDQVEEWITVCGLEPKDAEFAIYIGDKNFIISELKSDELAELREDYNKAIGKGVNDTIKTTSLKRKIEEVIDPSDKSWKNIKLDFTPELVQEWQKHGFSREETSDWINIGMGITDTEFCAWLRDIKKVDTEWVLNHGEVEELQSEYQQSLLMAQQIQ